MMLLAAGWYRSTYWRQHQERIADEHDKRHIEGVYLGARPESLSRAFHELECDGAIRINDPYDVDVLDLTVLIDAAGHDLVLDEET